MVDQGVSRTVTTSEYITYAMIILGDGEYTKLTPEKIKSIIKHVKDKTLLIENLQMIIKELRK